MATRKRTTPQSSSSNARESQHPLVQQSHTTPTPAVTQSSSSAIAQTAQTQTAQAQHVTNSGISIDGVTFPRTTVEVIKRRAQTPRA